jgi:hypothetical protein
LKGKRNKTLKACKEIPASLSLRRTAVKFDVSCSFSALPHKPTLRRNPPKAARRNYASFAAIKPEADEWPCPLSPHSFLYISLRLILFCEKNQFNFSLKTNLSIKDLSYGFHEALNTSVVQVFSSYTNKTLTLESGSFSDDNFTKK